MEPSRSFQRHQIRPSGPDVFDEEACRDFLYEIGLEIPAMYDYGVGMDEVYTRMVARFGPQKIADCMGLLNDFLKDDSSGAGHGDESDIWRSWRHAHRHRGDDLSNPGTPRNIGFILPAPTPKAIRDQKAKKFLELSMGAQNSLRRFQTSFTSWAMSLTSVSLGWPPVTEEPSSTASTPKALEAPTSSKVQWRTPHTAIQEVNAHDKIRHRLQALASLEGRGGPLVVANFDNLFPESDYPADGPRGLTPSMFYGSLKRNHDQEGRMQIPLILIRGTPRDALDSTSNDNDQSIPRCELAESSSNSDALLLPATVYRPEPKVMLKPTGSLPSSDLFLLPATTYRPPHRVRVLKPLSEVNVLSSTRPEQELLLPTTYQAPCHKRVEGPSGSDEGRLHSQATGSSQKIPAPPMRSREGRPAVDPRRWVRARQAFIRGETLEGLNLELNQRTARLAKSDRVATPEPHSLSTPEPLAGTRMEAGDEDIGCDQHYNEAFTGRSIDLNRELPALPIDERNQKALKINTDCPLSSFVSPTNLGSAKTTSSTTRSSTISSKKDFRHLTHGLMNPDAPEFSERLSASYEPLEPTKFSSLDARKPLPKLEEHYPYLDTGAYPDFSDHTRQTRWPAPEMESRKYRSDPSTSLPNRANLPQSQSEHNFRRIEDTQQPTFDIPRRHRANSEDGNFSDAIVHRILSPTSPKCSPSPTRGRFFGRSLSPARNLEDLDEDDVFQYGSSPKRSRSPKKLFGEGGWLGKSPSIKEKKSGIKQLSDKLKQGIEDLTEGIKALPAAFHQESSPSSEPTNSKFPVSLDPPTQARIYAEIELMICVTANKFLITQYDAGRTSLDSVKKITEYWSSLNRPQVIEFQFDQATQRELILANLKTFEFNGEAKENSIVLQSVLYNWRVIAKEMSVRTFCTPDSVVRKHMHDVHKILEMLGAPLVTFLAFQEIQIKALDTIKNEQEKRMMRNSANSANSGNVGRSGGRVEMMH